MSFVLALMALALSPSFQANAGAVRAGTPASQDVANRLAGIVLPRDAILATRLPRFDETFAETLAADERLIAVERTHPGVKKAVAAAARDEAALGYTRALDLLRADVAVLYRARFTPAELGTLVAFFTTPTGQALIALSAESSGGTATAHDADRRRRAMAMIQEPDEQVKADLTRLMASGLLPKVRTVNPDVAALSARRFDDVANLVSAALPARVDATIAAFKRKAR